MTHRELLWAVRVPMVASHRRSLNPDETGTSKELEKSGKGLRLNPTKEALSHADMH